MKTLPLILSLFFWIANPLWAQTKVTQPSSNTQTLFKKTFGNNWNIQTDGGKNFYFGGSIPLPGKVLKWKDVVKIEKQRATAVESNVKSFLSRNGSIFNLPLPDLKLFKSDCDPSSYGGEICFIHYTQKYKNFDVIPSSLLIVTHNNKIVSIKDTTLKGINISTTPTIPESKAVEIVLKKMETTQSPQFIRLVIFSDSKNEPHLAYAIAMPEIFFGTQKVPQYLESNSLPTAPIYYIDAQTGGILARQETINGAIIQGTIRGQYYPISAIDAPAATVFDDLGLQINQQQTFSNQNGTYSLNVGNGLAQIQSNLSGRYADIQNEEQNRASYSANVQVPARHDIDWAQNDHSNNQEESNAYYHINTIHDFMTRGGVFDIHQMDFPIQATVNYRFAEGLDCNALSACAIGREIGTPERTRLRFYGRSERCYSGALNADIIHHEYTHSVICNLYPHGLHSDHLDSTALNEGLADYFAGTMRNDSCIMQNRGIDQERDCERPLENDSQYPVGVEPHARGRSIAGAIWAARTQLGIAFTDELVMRTIKTNPLTFREFLDSFILMDDDNGNLNDGTPHLATICQAFIAHNINSPLCIDYLEQPIVNISQPVNGAAVNDNFEVIGNLISGQRAHLIRYGVEYSVDNGEHWSSEGVQLLLADPLFAVENSLARVNLGGNEQAVQLKFWATSQEGERFEDVINIIRYQNGWPLADGPSLNQLILNEKQRIRVFDFNQDGHSEIMVNHDAPRESFHIYNNRGQPIIGVATRPEYRPDQYAVNDVNGDGTLDIAGKYSINSETPITHIVITLLNQNSIQENDVVSIPVDDQLDISIDDFPCRSGPIIDNIDHDAEAEIIVRTRSKVWVFENNGQLRNGWPQSVIGDFQFTPNDLGFFRCSDVIVDDWDGDGEKEIIALSQFTQLTQFFVWDNNGGSKPGWPVQMPVSSITISADIIPETRGREVVASDKDQRFDIQIIGNNGEIFRVINRAPSPIVGNLENDRIVLVNPNGIYSSNGTLLYSFDYGEFSNYYASTPIAIADIMDDASMEIAMCVQRERDGVNSVLIFNRRGILMKDFNLGANFDCERLLIEDFDDDGYLELGAALPNFLFIWEIGSSRASRIEWNMQTGNNANTNVYSPRILNIRTLYGDITGDQQFNKTDIECYFGEFKTNGAKGCTHAPLPQYDLNCNGELDNNDIAAALTLFHQLHFPEAMDRNRDGVPDCIPRKILKTIPGKRLPDLQWITPQ